MIGASLAQFRPKHVYNTLLSQAVIGHPSTNSVLLLGWDETRRFQRGVAVVIGPKKWKVWQHLALAEGYSNAIFAPHFHP